MKHGLRIGCIGAALLVLLTFTTLAQQPVPQGINLNQRPTLAVSGAGRLLAAPDRAIIRLGAQIQADDAAAAQARVNEIMQKTVAAIEKLGVQKKSIRTTGLNLYPVFANPAPGRETEPPRISAYRASNTLNVTVDDLALVGKAIDAGMTAGVNQLEGVSFEIRNDLPHRLEALKLAGAEARAKAEAMAESLGLKLGILREVSESGVSIEPPRPMFESTMRFARGAADASVQPGETAIEAAVTLRFDIQSQ